VRWSLFAVLIALLLGATGGPAVDTAGRWVAHEYDRLPWYVTRISALLAYGALTSSVVYGLLLSTKILDKVAHRAVSFTLHQDLAGIGLGLALVHIAILMLDRSVPYQPLEIVVPFSGPYRPLWVAAGQLGLALSLVVMLSFYARRRIGSSVWRRLHYLSFAAFLLVTVHGLMAGSDTSAGWVYIGYLVAATAVAFLTAYRAVSALATHSTRQGGVASPGQDPGPV
jgi:DMSO/TMAO reductase YedYZ heme-binding membrane subunit